MSNAKAISFETTLGEIGVFEKSYTFSRAVEGQGEVKQIHYGDIHTKLPNIIKDASVLPTIRQQDDFQFINYGDVIIADASEDYKDLGKAVCYLDQEEKKVISGLHTHRLKVDKSKVVPEYLINIFQTSRYRKFVWKMGTGVSVLGLSKSNLSKYPVTLPNIETQRKIGFFFGELNKKIQLQQEKINLLKEQKKSYMQMIFNQQIQFKKENNGNHHEWREVAVSDILALHLREIPKPNESYIRLGLRSHAKGTFHEVISNPETVSMDKLFVVHEGDFIINITFAWEQALAIADKEDHGKLVSHRFPTYRFNEGHYSEFYKYYFTTKYFKYCLGNASPGGAGRNRVLNKKDFMNIRIKVPKYDEQLEIANFLFKLDQRVQLEQQKMNNLQEQKKGFIQKMFI